MTIMRPIIFVIKPFLENKASRFIETLGVNNIALFGGTLEPQSSHINLLVLCQIGFCCEGRHRKRQASAPPMWLAGRCNS